MHDFAIEQIIGVCKEAECLTARQSEAFAQVGVQLRIARGLAFVGCGILLTQGLGEVQAHLPIGARIIETDAEAYRRNARQGH